MNTLLRESKKYFTCFQQSNVWSYYGLRRATIPTFYIRGITSASSKSHVASSEKAVEEENINNDLDFGDFKKAFMAKSTFEIVRALSVYKLCSFNALVEHNRSLITLSRKLLGKTGFEFLMKNSFYGHFVAGETQSEIKSYLALMKSYGVGAILDYAVEADIPLTKIEESAETDKSVDEVQLSIANVEERYKVHKELADRREHVISARTYFYEGEEKCDENMEVFLQCIDTTGATSENGFAAIKATALGRPVLLLRLSQILNQTQNYFNMLACNEDSVLTERKIAEETFQQGLKDLGIDMTSEEASYVFNIIDANKDGGIDIHEWHNFLTPQLQLAKLFRAKPSKKGEKGQEILATLTQTELKEMENMTDRLLTIAQRAKERNVRLMVDAEQTYFQPAISRITLEAMRVFNHGQDPVVFNTYQCYLKETKSNLLLDMELARREGFKFACKLVRGAYMEQERSRAEAYQYPDPIHETKQDTDNCYNDMLGHVLQEVREHGANLMVASHNENSVRTAINIMNDFGINRADNAVFFGQLLGMCDVITYALGGAGYSALKYVPYGPVEDVVPYLSRRAMENKSVMKGVQKEREMLWKEFVRRFKAGELRHDPYSITR